MKYLKSFKIFESLTSMDLLGTINDIFISLDDSGIEYNIEDLKNIGLIHIEIKGQNEEINDCIEHLINYLKDLGHLYFISRSIKGETHISIDNGFNMEIEKDFLKIIDGIIEIKKPNSIIWLNPDGYRLFVQSEEASYLFYDYDKIYKFFRLKYYPNPTSDSPLEIDEIIRYLMSKHLKLEALRPKMFLMGKPKEYDLDYIKNLYHNNQ